MPDQPAHAPARPRSRRLVVLVVAVLALVLAAAWAAFPDRDPEPTPEPEPEEVAGQATMRLPGRALVAGKPFTVRGRLTPPSTRKVRLQVEREGGFETLARTTSAPSGAFRFEGVTLAEGEHVLRAHSPATTTESPRAVLLPVESAPITGIRVRRPHSVSATALAPVAQAVTDTPAAAGSAPQVAARFTPAEPGREAFLQRRTPGGWRTVARQEQDRVGWVVFDSRAGETYRVSDGNRKATTSTTSDPVTPQEWRVDFADDFAGDRVDERFWLFEQSGYTPIGQRSCSAADASALQVAGGALRMGVRVNPERAGQVCRYPRPGGRVGEHPFMFNTQINTRGKYTFRYGFAAARMKLQRARGMHSAFWLLPENWELPPGNPAGGTEVDIVEWFGHDPNPRGLGINAFIHYRDAAGGRVKIGDPVEEGYRDLVAQLHDEGEEWWNAYHVFSVEWTPQAYVFRVDGREFYRETRAITHTPAYVSLSMLIGDYELKHLTPEGRSDAAMVDWVRIYQRP